MGNPWRLVLFTTSIFALCFTIAGACLVPFRADALPLDTTLILQDWAQVVDPYGGIDGQGWSAPDSTTLRGLFDTSSTGAIVSPFQVQDMVFTTDVLTTGDNDHLGLVFGYQDPDNLYYVVWSGPGSGVQGVQVRRKLAGVDAILFDSPGDTWINNVIHTIRVERIGSDLSVTHADSVRSILERIVVHAISWRALRDSMREVLGKLDESRPDDQTLGRLVAGFLDQLGAQRSTGIDGSA